MSGGEGGAAGGLVGGEGGLGGAGGSVSGGQAGQGGNGLGCGGKTGAVGVAALEAGKVKFCIDAYETTRAEYAEFLEALPGLDVAALQPATCGWNTVLKPHDWANPADENPALWGDDPKKPVGAVDWCDAATYCAYRGKRLCGKLGDGAKPSSFTDLDNIQESEWTYACSKGSAARAYPYGNEFQASACKVGSSKNYDTKPVGSFVSCEGGFSGLFDMSGNIQEWENSCESESGEGTEAQQRATKCALRGGSWNFPMGSVGCRSPAETYRRDSMDTPQTGIRCCWDPT